MDIHKNARTTPLCRMLMVQRLASGWTVAAVAAAHGSPPEPCANGVSAMHWRTRRAWPTAPLNRTAARPGSAFQPKAMSLRSAASV